MVTPLRPIRSKLLCFWLPLIALLSWIPQGALAQTTFRAEAPSAVSLSEKIRVQFVLRNGDGTDFTAPEVEGASVLFPPNNAVSRANINGKISVTYTGTYLAERTGTVRIGKASIKVKGKTYYTQPLNIRILSDEKNGGKSQSQVSKATDMFIRATPSKTSAYEQEAILVTYKLYTRNANIDFENVKFPEYDGFIEQPIERSRNVQLSLEQVNGKNYYSAVLHQTLIFPQRSGSLNIPQGEFDLIAAVEQKIDNEDDYFGISSISQVRKKILSPAIPLNIRELPQPAPEGFDGADALTLGKNQVEAFFSSVLPVVKNVAEVEIAPSFSARYEALPLAVEIYLDYYREGIEARLLFRYGAAQYDPLREMPPGEHNGKKLLRDTAAEERVKGIFFAYGFAVEDGRLVQPEEEAEQGAGYSRVHERPSTRRRSTAAHGSRQRGRSPSSSSPRPRLRARLDVGEDLRRSSRLRLDPSAAPSGRPGPTGAVARRGRGHPDRRSAVRHRRQFARRAPGQRAGGTAARAGRSARAARARRAPGGRPEASSASRGGGDRPGPHRFSRRGFRGRVLRHGRGADRGRLAEVPHLGASGYSRRGPARGGPTGEEIHPSGCASRGPFRRIRRPGSRDHGPPGPRRRVRRPAVAHGLLPERHLRRAQQGGPQRPPRAAPERSGPAGRMAGRGRRHLLTRPAAPAPPPAPPRRD